MSDSEEVREEGKEFQRRGPEKAKADLAKECLTDMIKKWLEEEDRRPARFGFTIKSFKYLGEILLLILNIKVQILKIILNFKGSQCRWRRKGEIWENKGARATNRAAELKALLRGYKVEKGSP